MSATRGMQNRGSNGSKSSNQANTQAKQSRLSPTDPKKSQHILNHSEPSRMTSGQYRSSSIQPPTLRSQLLGPQPPLNDQQIRTQPSWQLAPFTCLQGGEHCHLRNSFSSPSAIVGAKNCFRAHRMSYRTHGVETRLCELAHTHGSVTVTGRAQQLQKLPALQLEHPVCLSTIKAASHSPTSQPTRSRAGYFSCTIY